MGCSDAQAQRHRWTDIGKDQDGIDDQLHLRIDLFIALHPHAVGDADTPVPWKKRHSTFFPFLSSLFLFVPLLRLLFIFLANPSHPGTEIEQYPLVFEFF